MSAARLTADVTLPFYAAMMCLAPAMTRPTVPFGVRVPAERARATVIRHERRVYYARTAAIGACCIVLAVLLQGYGPWWLTRIILLLEVAADLGCYWLPGGAGDRGSAAGTDRDDDRFWKAGLVYVNRDDPALLVGARFGVGWTFNLANPAAWLVIAAIVAAPAGRAAIGAAAGL